MAGATWAVFLSYRREETRHVAGRLADRLTDRLGPEQVFIDVDTIEPGADFAAAIAREVASCNVLIALIGPTWSTTTDQRGRRGLDDPEDLVVLEIRAALERGIHVIPVLVDGAVMPDRGDLPEGLQGLARRNAVRLDHDTFRSDVTILLNAVDRILSTPTQKSSGPAVGTDTGVADRAIAPSPTLWSRPRTRVLITAVIVITLIVAGSIVLLATKNPPGSGGPALTTASTPPSVITTLPVGDYPSGVAVSPDGGHAYIISESGSVSVIDTGSNTVTTTIPVGDGPSGVAVSPDGRHAYITNYSSGSVSVIDTGVG